MSQTKTKVGAVTVRSRAPLGEVKEPERRQNKMREAPVSADAGMKTPLTFGERMLRNTAVCVALLLCVVATASIQNDGARSVSATLSQIVSMDIKESLGSLRFVSSLIPESVSVFWNLGGEKHSKPSTADVVQVFSQGEPYTIYGMGEALASAAGEVMSLAIDPVGRASVRIRHASGMETLYGNLLGTSVREGDWVEAGDVIGMARALTYELRGEGRAMDPAPYFK